MKVVSNSSALIALIEKGQLTILKELFEEVLIPESVQKEVFGHRKKPDWIKVLKLKHPLASQVLEADLGAGESEAICLYKEASADLLILDDLPARRIAEILNIRITGTLGILIRAKEKRFIKEVKDLMDELILNGFRVSEDLYQNALELAGES